MGVLIRYILLVYKFYISEDMEKFGKSTLANSESHHAHRKENVEFFFFKLELRPLEGSHH